MRPNPTIVPGNRRLVRAALTSTGMATEEPRAGGSGEGHMSRGLDMCQ